MYNYKYGGLFILFGIALAALYSGAVALKIRHYEVPLGRGIELRGRSATAAGIVLLMIGVASLVALAMLVTAAVPPSPGGAPLDPVLDLPVVGMRLVLVEPGTFIMGSPPDEPAREAQERRWRVTLRRPFYLGETEVTQAQWETVMGSNPSRVPDCPRCPVETVDAEDAGRFLDAMATRFGGRFRLPSEAEWEYACRAGTITAFAHGDTLTSDDANFDGRYPLPGEAKTEFRGRTTPVASFAPNAWGLFDMHGNVWEWTADPHCPYPTAAATDPRPSCDSPLLVIRGGSWLFGADSARCALRYTHAPEDDGPSLGLRVLREVPR